jgi:hypothetical protein
MKNTETKKELSTRFPQRANRFISITRVGTKEIQKVNTTLKHFLKQKSDETPTAVAEAKAEKAEKKASKK